MYKHIYIFNIWKFFENLQITFLADERKKSWSQIENNGVALIPWHCVCTYTFMPHHALRRYINGFINFSLDDFPSSSACTRLCRKAVASAPDITAARGEVRLTRIAFLTTDRNARDMRRRPEKIIEILPREKKKIMDTLAHVPEHRKYARNSSDLGSRRASKWKPRGWSLIQR